MVEAAMETDVVIVGSGLAGLVAARRALEFNADVVLLEKGDKLGGTTRTTGGYIAVDREKEPNVDAHEPIDESLAWLQDQGVTVEELDHWEHGEIQTSSTRIDPPQFVERMREQIESSGGEILLRTPFKELRTGADGAISGVVAHRADSGQFEIAALNVILAAGGRSANEGILDEYYPHTHLQLGRDPWSTGDGFIAATDVGAKTTGKLSNPVGVSRPAPPAEISFEDMRCGQIYDTSSIAIDTNGRRFTDESDTTAQSNGFIESYLKNVEGEVFLIIDQELYENNDRYQSPISDRVELARELGGVVLEAETLEGLVENMESHGVHGERALATIEEFNRAMRGGDVDLDPSRSAYREPIDTAPFYAIKVIPAILYFVGGLDIDDHARVVSRALSSSTLRYKPETAGEEIRTPIEGLYAAGVDVGKRIEDGYYGGGLSLALATGRIAGKHAAERVTEIDAATQ